MVKSTFVWKVDPEKSFEKLSRGIKNKAMRIALNAGAAPVKAAAISQAPKDRGHLAKATIIKVKNYRNLNTWVAVVGAGWRYKRKKKLKSGESRTIRPALYQGFVERGTKNVRGRHYLQHSFGVSRQQFEQVARQKLRQVITDLIRQN